MGDDIVNRKVILFSALIIIISILSGCRKEKTIETMVPISPSTGIEINKPSKEEPKTPEKKPLEFFAPYTGEKVDEKKSKNIPFMAIIENSKDARPQSGLNDADIVYETMAEGGIPRFIALFQKNSPAKIGPIRSARPYFINISKEYNIPFAHCGYSTEAKEMIEKEKLMSMNEFFLTGFYWRDRERKAPHNLYTSAEKLRSAAVSRGFVKIPKLPLKFNKEFWTSENHSNAQDIDLKFNKYYSTSYNYTNGKYYKSINNDAFSNKEDSKAVAITNVVVQITSITLQSDKQHLDIDLVGEGAGYVFSNGKYTKMKWSKKNINSATILKDENGLDIPLSPGNTWWHIIDKSNTVQIK